MNVRLDFNKVALLFFIVMMPIVLNGCSEPPENADYAKETEITGMAVQETVGCEYPDGSICLQECCAFEEKCANGGSLHRRCDPIAGKWGNFNYSDFECSEKCKPLADVQEINADDPDNVKIEDVEIEGEKLTELKAEANLSRCSYGWKCVDDRYRALQYSDCSWSQVEYCDYKCGNGTCMNAPACKPDSLKCFGKMLKKCSDDGSGWEDHESCDYDCEDRKCMNETAENAQNDTAVQNSTQLTQQSCDSSCFEITNFHYAGVDDCDNLNNEYVTIKNKCDYGCGMAGWTVNDNSSKAPYVFPQFNLGSNLEVTLYTGCGTNSNDKLYWCSSGNNLCNAIWNNKGDTLYLKNPEGTLILEHSYS